MPFRPFPEEFVKIQDYTRKVTKDSPWRNCIFKVMDYKKYEEEPVEEGEEPEEDTRDIFYTDLYVYLGKQYAEYVDWMAKTSVVPLWGKLEEVWPEGYVPPVPTPSLLQLRPDSSTERLIYSSISLVISVISS